MPGNHLIQSLRRKQKNTESPIETMLQRSEKKRKKTTIDGQVQDEENDKHIDSNNCVKNIVMR